jgi:hypothetical protein
MRSKAKLFDEADVCTQARRATSDEIVGKVNLPQRMVFAMLLQGRHEMNDKPGLSFCIVCCCSIGIGEKLYLRRGAGELE